MRMYKINRIFGKRVKRARKAMNISQEELAGRVGISRNHMGRVERGGVNVTLVLAEKIAKQLKVKSSQLLPF